MKKAFIFIIIIFLISIIVSPKFVEASGILCPPTCPPTIPPTPVLTVAAEQATVTAALEFGVPIPNLPTLFPLHISPVNGPVDELDIDAGTFVNYDGNTLELSEANKIVTDSGIEMHNVEDVSVSDDGTYSAGDIEILKHGELAILNAVNVVFENNKLKADNAGSVMNKKYKTVTTDIDNLEIDLSQLTEILSFGEADEIRFYCIIVTNVVNTSFTVNPNQLNMFPAEGVSLGIEDCNNAESVFNASKFSQVSVTKDPTYYSIKNGTIEFKKDDFMERLEANNSANLSIDAEFGFECMIIEPAGTYFYNHADMIKDFAVHIPGNSSNYSLCIRKDISQSFTDYNGLVDFVGKSMELKGIVKYLRYPFQLIENSYQLTGLLMETVYESRDFSNKADFALDNDFIFINDFYLENQNPANDVIAIIKSGYHVLIEKKSHSTKRYEQINSKPIAELITDYSTSFHKPKIRIKEGTLAQKTIPDPTVIVFSPASEDLKRFENLLNDYYSHEIILEEST